MLSCFEALVKIRKIMDIQAEEKKKGIKTAVEEEKPSETEEKKDTKTVIAVETDTLPADEPDIEKYGRKWIWHTYISEAIKGEWENAAGMLRHINEHVIQDIRDWILIQGFDPKIQKDRKAIADKVETLLVNPEKIKSKEGKEEFDNIK